MSKSACNLIYKHPYSGGGDVKSTETPEFIVRIFPNEFEAWKKRKCCNFVVNSFKINYYSLLVDPNEIPLVEVVDAFEVFVARTRGHTGAIERPSNQELMSVFGSIKFEEIFSFMAEHGICKHAGADLDKKGQWYNMF